MGSKVNRPLYIRHTKSSVLQHSTASEKIRKNKEKEQTSRYGPPSFSYHERSTKFQPKVRPERRQLNANLEFYSNKIRSRPVPGYTIEDMLKWKGNYEMLERNHRYIQWLFPIPDGRGMNHMAQPLQAHEAEAIRSDAVLRKRVLKAYKMMLHFYGMELASDVDGSVRRCADNWRHRYKHLNKSKHNYLRITRIIKSLGELGLDRYQVPWVRFMIEEATDHRELPGVMGSIYFWVYAIKNSREMDFIRDSVKRVLPEPDGAHEEFSEEEDETEDELREDLEEGAADNYYAYKGSERESHDTDIGDGLSKMSITGQHGKTDSKKHVHHDRGVEGW